MVDGDDDPGCLRNTDPRASSRVPEVAARRLDLELLTGGDDPHGDLGDLLVTQLSRRTLGAGIVPNDASGFMRWLERADLLKPGVHMPHFRMLPREERQALAAYLEALQ